MYTIFAKYLAMYHKWNTLPHIFSCIRIKSPRKISLNAVEREPVETRVLNPNASEASYKPEQRSYRKTKLRKNNFLFFFSGGFWSGGFYPGTIFSIWYDQSNLNITSLQTKKSISKYKQFRCAGFLELWFLLVTSLSKTTRLQPLWWQEGLG